jgi:hypothetical protein
LKELTEYAVEMVFYDMIYIPSFEKIGIGFHALLRFSFRNLEDCKVGITDWREL